MVVNLMRSWPTALAFAAFLAAPAVLVAQAPVTADSSSPAQTPPPSPAPVLAPLPVHVTVVGTMPLPGVELPLDRVPAPVQSATAEELRASGALDLSDFAT